MSADPIAQAGRLHTRAPRHRECGPSHRAGPLRRLVRACGADHADVANALRALGNVPPGLGRSERRRARYTGF